MTNPIQRILRGEHIVPPTAVAQETASPALHDEPPERLTPVVETYPAQVFPYRGTETHGVAPTERWEDVPVVDTVEADYEPVGEQIEPVPVRVVGGEGPQDIGSFVTGQWLIPATEVMRIGSRQLNRTDLLIVNTGGTTCYVGSKDSVPPFMGFPLAPGASVSLQVRCPVWIRSDGISAGAVATLEQRHDQ